MRAGWGKLTAIPIVVLATTLTVACSRGGFFGPDGGAGAIGGAGGDGGGGAQSGGGSGGGVTPPPAVVFTVPDIDDVRVSQFASASFTIAGTCTEGLPVELGGDVTVAPACDPDGTWSTVLDLSGLPDGDVSIVATQTNPAGTSPPASRTVILQAAFCAANLTAAPFAGGSGSTGAPYQICTRAQLEAIAGVPDAVFELHNDLDLLGSDHTPISIAGTFDGLGFTVYNLTVNGASYCGFFAGLTGATVKNLRLVFAEVTCDNYVGILAGEVVGPSLVEAVVAEGTVTSTHPSPFFVGGLIGWINGGGVTVMGSSATATINSPIAGGLVGRISDDAIIENVSTNGVITGGGGGLIGGMVDPGTTIRDAHARVDLAGGGGGLVGSIEATGNVIVDCLASGNVLPTLTAGKAGGLVAHAIGDTIIRRSFATGRVAADSNTGGLVGEIYGASQILDSYATGDVSGTDRVGGLAGYAAPTVIIERSYSLGAVSGAPGPVAAFAPSSPVITDCYWNLDTAGVADASGAIGLTDSQMQDQTNFVGFDFSSTWVMNPGISSYPVLTWQ